MCPAAKSNFQKTFESSISQQQQSMHRRRAATFLSRSYRVSQARSASSAAAYATRSVPESDDCATSRAAPPNLSKWARPATPTQSTSQKQQQHPNRRQPSRDATGKASFDRSTSDSSNTGWTATATRQDMFRNARQSSQARQRPVPQAKNWGLGSQGSRAPSMSATTQAASSSQTRIQRDDLPHMNSAAQRSGMSERRRDGPSSAAASSSSLIDSNYIDTAGFAEDPERGRHRRDKSAFKERGSLVSRNGDVLIENKVDAKAELERRQQQRRAKAATRKRPRQLVEVYIPSIVSVGQLAQLLKVKLDRLQRKMREAGMGEEASYDHVLTSDYAALLAEEFNRKPIFNDEAAFDLYPPPPHPKPETLPARPPVVAIMGHVDHGKTTLLDTLRSTSVAAGEAGGITQHIGAFSVDVSPSAESKEKRSITFLDTPGHAAFSAMRARGARATDIIVLVVAADDGVMPQTREVIDLVMKDAEEAGGSGKVGLVVALNKVDKPGADPELVQMDLLSAGVQVEAMGGDIPCVPVSGLKGTGLAELAETISTMAELQDLRAERDGVVYGHVLESNVHKGLGNTATVLVLRGCLKPGMHILAGTSQAKVRVMNNASGKSVKEAHPGTAVIVSGWKTLPSAGDSVLSASEGDIKKALTNRLRKAEEETQLADIEAINEKRREERERVEEEERALANTRRPVNNRAPTIEIEGQSDVKELRLVIKGDVSGSVEAVEDALKVIGNSSARVKVISRGVGEVSESDVMLAKTAGGVIIAFNTNVPKNIAVLAARNEVTITSSKIIYRLTEEVTERVTALLPSTIERRVTGEATVAQVFEIDGKGSSKIHIAGCRITDGLAEKAKRVTVIRDDKAVHEGTVDTLRILRKDVLEVKKGTECGIGLEGFNDIKEGDVIQFHHEVEIPGVL